MKYWRVCFFLALVLAVFGGFSEKGSGEYIEKKALQELFPSMQLPQKSGAPPHYRISSDLVAFNTTDIVPDIRGYGGPISALVVLTVDGRIKALRILSHRETENYVHYLFSEGFLRTLTGKSVNDPFQVGRDVDAVSRATVSQEALCKSIHLSAKKVAREVLGLEVEETTEVVRRTSLRPFLFSLWFFFVVAFYLFTKKHKGLLRYRNIILFGSLLLMGVYLSTFFSIIHLIQVLKAEVSFRWQWWLLVGGVGLSFLISGRFYCGWLCPFGAVTELLGQRLPQWSPSEGYDRMLRSVKYLFLIGLTAGVFFGLGPVHIDFEPYLTLFSFRGNLFTWAIVVVSLLAGLKISRPWCRYLCPVGALSGLFERPQKGYRGMQDCPVGLSQYVSGECIRCNRCYQRM